MLLTRAADAVLRRIVPTVEAGACIPPEPCGCVFRYHWCRGEQCYASYWNATTDCYGRCTRWGDWCYSKPAGPCSAAACTA